MAVSEVTAVVEGGFGGEYTVRKVTEIFSLGDKMSCRLCGSIYNAC